MNGCGACEHFKATWNSYVANHKNQCAIAVERQNNPSKHGMNLGKHQKKVSAFPTIMLIERNGNSLGEMVGSITENTLETFVESSMGN